MESKMGTDSAEDSTQMAPDLLTVPEAARRLRMHPDSLYRLIREGQFSPALTIGHSVRVSVPRLERYLHGDQLTGAPHPTQESRELDA
jgi:excisionase family DNA binding protein